MKRTTPFPPFGTRTHEHKATISVVFENHSQDDCIHEKRTKSSNTDQARIQRYQSVLQCSKSKQNISSYILLGVRASPIKDPLFYDLDRRIPMALEGHSMVDNCYMNQALTISTKISCLGRKHPSIQCPLMFFPTHPAPSVKPTSHYQHLAGAKERLIPPAQGKQPSARRHTDSLAGLAFLVPPRAASASRHPPQGHGWRPLGRPKKSARHNTKQTGTRVHGTRKSRS